MEQELTFPSWRAIYSTFPKTSAWQEAKRRWTPEKDASLKSEWMLSMDGELYPLCGKSKRLAMHPLWDRASWFRENKQELGQDEVKRLILTTFYHLELVLALLSIQEGLAQIILLHN